MIVHSKISKNVRDIYILGGFILAKEKLQIIPLGGLGEIGKNMTGFGLGISG